MATAKFTEKKCNTVHHLTILALWKLKIYFSLYPHKSIIIFYKCAYTSCVWFPMGHCTISIPAGYFKNSGSKNTVLEQDVVSVLAYVSSLDGHDSHYFLHYPIPHGIDKTNFTYSSCSWTFRSWPTFHSLNTTAKHTSLI